MSESDKPATTIVARFSDFIDKPKLKRMNEDDRLAFIDWMFEHFRDVDMTKSSSRIAIELTDLYKAQHPMLLNHNWVNNLLRSGIYKLSDGTYGFERKDVTYTVKEICRNPSLFRNIKW